MIKVSEYKHDTLKREKIIKNLSKMIVTHNDSFVLNINAKWGAGKTTFVKIWREHLEKKYELKSIYFSAWEDDFSKEPLILILGEINTYLENIKTTDTVKKKFDKVKNIASKIITKGLPAFIKGSTAGLLDLDKGYEAAISSLTEKATLELIESHTTNKNQILQFKELLSEIVKELNSDYPLIIFIDELDRCRPTYAIELLERIKHLFGIKKVIFVLSTDKVQLSHSIKVLYGDIDTENYLRRFIDLEYNLPNITNITEYLTMLEAQYQVTSGLSNMSFEKTELLYARERIMEPLYYNLELTLRQVEEIYRYQRIIYWSSHNSFLDSFALTLPVLLAIKVYDDTIYKDLIHFKSDKNIIIKKLLSNDSKFIHDVDKFNIEAVVLFLLPSDENEKNLLISLEDELKLTKSHEDANRVGTLIEIGNHYSGKISFSRQIQQAIDKIEFSDAFTFEDDAYLESLEKL